MELQLGLALPTQNIIKGFDLNKNLGLNHQARACFGEKGYVTKNKRCFEQAFGDLTEDCKAMPLLLWSGQPNEEEEDDHQKKQADSSSIDENEAEDDDQVVGWPPIKTWRKKLLLHQRHHHHHHHQVGRVVVENNNGPMAEIEEENIGRSVYVKVKMEGVAIARKVDIRLYHSYQALTNSLITMFAKAKHQKSTDEVDYTRYTLTYQDKEGDWLIAGDIPWQTFIRSVQRLELVRKSG